WAREAGGPEAQGDARARRHLHCADRHVLRRRLAMAEGGPVSAFDLSTTRGRLATYLHYVWKDHAYLRLAFKNAHWISDELARANQPWPFQVKTWRDHGIRTIVNLRHGVDSPPAPEQEPCDKYGVKQVYFIVWSREAPSREQVLGAKAL